MNAESPAVIGRVVLHKAASTVATFVQVKTKQVLPPRSKH